MRYTPRISDIAESAGWLEMISQHRACRTYEPSCATILWPREVPSLWRDTLDQSISSTVVTSTVSKTRVDAWQYDAAELIAALRLSSSNVRDAVSDEANSLLSIWSIYRASPSYMSSKSTSARTLDSTASSRTTGEPPRIRSTSEARRTVPQRCKEEGLVENLMRHVLITTCQ